MFQIAFFGSPELVDRQLAEVVRLIEEYGLPMFDGEKSVNDEVHVVREGAEDGFDLVCTAIELDILVLGDATPLSVRQFLSEAMTLVGVYQACPECTKRRYWATKNVPPAVSVEG